MSRPRLSAVQIEYGHVLGRRLRTARDGRGLSGSELARLSGVDLDAIRRIELGKVASPGFALMAALRGPLKVSLDDLARAVEREVGP